jgi:hypothetical protein
MVKVPEEWLHRAYQLRLGFPESLIGLKGETIRILHPGRYNRDNGPDFLNALLEIDGIRYSCDVEIHCSLAEWFLHGHDQDSRYARVRLHLLWEPPPSLPAQLSQRMHHAALLPQLTLSVSEWQQLLQQFEDHPHLHNDRPSATLTASLLPHLAEQRINRKIDRMSNWLQHFAPEDVLWIALAEAMGYSKNKFPMRQLLWQYPPSCWDRFLVAGISGPWQLWWLLLHLGGLAPMVLRKQTTNLSTDICGDARWLLDKWHRECLPVLSETDWYFSRLRPYNAPFIRLAGLSELWFRWRHNGLFKTLLSEARQRPPYPVLLKKWQAILQHSFSSAFSEKMRFTCGCKRLPAFVLGRERQHQFMLNSLLPLLCSWSEKTSNNGFWEYLWGAIEAFPSTEPQNLINRLTGGRSPLPEQLHKSGFYQQGLLEWAALHFAPAQNKHSK